MRLALIPCLLLLACGPMTMAEAERQCFERARLAQQPRGTLGVGVGSGGHAAGAVELEVSSDFLLGRDPSAIYETCVMARTGEPPSRPLYARPDWKG
ncbi:hypothetical protein ACFSKJ_14685 [Tabrizicola soli]